MRASNQPRPSAILGVPRKFAQHLDQTRDVEGVRGTQVVEIVDLINRPSLENSSTPGIRGSGSMGRPQRPSAPQLNTWPSTTDLMNVRVHVKSEMPPFTPWPPRGRQGSCARSALWHAVAHDVGGGPTLEMSTLPIQKGNVNRITARGNRMTAEMPMVISKPSALVG